MNLFEQKVDDLESNEFKLDLIISGENVPIENQDENIKRASIALIKEKLKVSALEKEVRLFCIKPPNCNSDRNGIYYHKVVKTCFSLYAF